MILINCRRWYGSVDPNRSLNCTGGEDKHILFIYFNGGIWWGDNIKGGTSGIGSIRSAHKSPAALLAGPHHFILVGPPFLSDQRVRAVSCERRNDALYLVTSTVGSRNRNLKICAHGWYQRADCFEICEICDPVVDVAIEYRSFLRRKDPTRTPNQNTFAPGPCQVGCSAPLFFLTSWLLTLIMNSVISI